MTIFIIFLQKIQLADPFAIYGTYFGSAYAAVKDMLKAKGTCQLEVLFIIITT